MDANFSQIITALLDVFFILLLIIIARLLQELNQFCRLVCCFAFLQMLIVKVILRDVMQEEKANFTFHFFHHKIMSGPGYHHILSPRCIHVAFKTI